MVADAISAVCISVKLSISTTLADFTAAPYFIMQQKPTAAQISLLHVQPYEITSQRSSGK